MLSFIRGICHFVIVLVLIVSLMCNFLFIKQIAQIKQERDSLRPAAADVEKPADAEKAEAETGQDTPNPNAVLPMPPIPSLQPPSSNPAPGRLALVRTVITDRNFACDGKTSTLRIRGVVNHLAQKTNDYKYEISPEPVRLDRIWADFYDDSIFAEGLFKIGETYRITLKAGAILYSGSVLKEDFSFAVTIPDPRPSVRFLSNGPYSPVKIQDGKVTGWQLPIAVTNADRIHVILWRQSNRNLDLMLDSFPYWGGTAIKESMMAKVAVKELQVPIVHNVTRKLALEMDKLFPGLAPGMYAVEVTNDPDRAQSKDEFFSYSGTHFAILSALGVTASMDGGRGIAVCVHDLNTLAPVQGAQVTVITTKRDIAAEGTTGKDGSILLTANPTIDLTDNNSPKTLLVSKGDDITFIKLDHDFLNSDHEYPDFKKDFRQRHYAFAYTERGIYRMGDTVCIGLFLRERDGGELKASQAPLEVTVEDPREVTILKRTVTPDANGFAKLECALPEAAYHGYYSVDITCGEDKGHTSFLVNAYEPDKVRVEATFDKEAYTPADQATLSYFGEYYMGAKVQNASYSLTLTLAPTTPPHWKGYSVGMKRSKNAIHTAARLSGLKNTSHTLPPFKQLLDRIDFNSPEAKTAFSSSPIAVSAQVGCTDAGSQTVTTRTSSVLLPTTCFLGLKYLGAEEMAAQFECRLLGWSPKEHPALPSPLNTFELKLKRCTWDYVLEDASDNRRMTWKQIETECPLDKRLVMEGESLRLALPALADGHYILTASNGDRIATQIDFWHEAGEAGSIRSENPNILVVTTNKSDYLPGDSVELAFDAISDGACFLAAGEKELDYQVAAPVTKGRNTLRLTIPKDILTAHYFATVTVVCRQGEDLARSFALVSIPVKQERHRMRITLDAPEKAEPKDKITLRLQCASQEGSPLPATLHLFAVDEGILALTAYKTPDIFEFFHGSYNCALNCYDLYGQLYPKLAIKGLERIGGDAEDDARLMRVMPLRHQKDAILLLDAIQVPENGLAEAELELPDHTGALRIMAVSAGKDAVGSESCMLTMRHKVTVMPKAPLFTSPGDRFRLLYKLINHELDSCDGTLRLSIPKELQADGAPSEFQVKLPKGEENTVELPCKAHAIGAFSIAHELDAGGRHYAGSCTINCRSPFQHISQVQNIHLKPGEHKELVAGDKDWETLDASDLKLAPSPAFAVASALDWLNQYPYGCVEQTVSTAFPFLNVDKLIAAGLVDKAYETDAASKLQAACFRVLSMRRGSRGFTMWPDSDWVWDEAGLYATHFLFSVPFLDMPESVSRDLMAYLENTWRGSLAKSPANAAYALYVQSIRQKGEAQCGKIRSALDQVPQANAFARFLLGAALFKAGEAAEASIILNDSLKAKCWLSQGEELPWFLNAACTRVGLFLSIAMQTLPRHPANAEMALFLAQKLRKDKNVWGTTRDNAWAAMGLAEFAFASPAKSTSFALNLGDAVKKETLAKPLHLPLHRTGKFSLDNTGDGDIFAQFTLKGIPKAMQNDTSVIRLKKQILDEAGKEAETVRPGDLLTVSISSENAIGIDSFVLLDLLPGGCAIENGSLATRQASTGDAEEKNDGILVRHKERHDDRFIIMGALDGGKPFAITYRMRAITPGSFAIPPVHLEDMYNPDIQATFVPDDRLEVKAE